MIDVRTASSDGLDGILGEDSVLGVDGERRQRSGDKFVINDNAAYGSAPDPY
jgi:hypothetical protein